MTDDPVWYVAYASNLSADRLRCYLSGGRPPGARRRYLGCRDPSPPSAVIALTVPGDLVFAGVSRVWGGALAFLDVAGTGEVAARAYRITADQLADLVAQEARQPVGTPLGPGVDGPDGSAWSTASRIYESVVDLGRLDDLPLLTLTTRRAVLEPAPPSAAYLRTILRGLGEATGWSPQERAAYLLRARGVEPRWSEDELLALCEGSPPRVAR